MLLHDPAGHDAWQGTFRLVTLVRAELEPEMAADPLLPEVCWSWLTGALQARGLTYGEPSGTVTRASSHYFGGLAERPAASQIEIRASWTPREGLGGVPDTAAHLAAWCDLLCQVAGLPPAGPGDASVVTLPQRRGPQSPRAAAFRLRSGAPCMSTGPCSTSGTAAPVCPCSLPVSSGLVDTATFSRSSDTRSRIAFDLRMIDRVSELHGLLLTKS